MSKKSIIFMTLFIAIILIFAILMTILFLKTRSELGSLKKEISETNNKNEVRNVLENKIGGEVNATGAFTEATIKMGDYNVEVFSKIVGHPDSDSYFGIAFTIETIDKDGTYVDNFYLGYEDIEKNVNTKRMDKVEINGKTFYYDKRELDDDVEIYYQINDKDYLEFEIKGTNAHYYDKNGNNKMTATHKPEIDEKVLKSKELAEVLKFEIK